MNIDLLYTSKKPLKLSKKEKEKILDIVFKLNQDVDKKIEYYLSENWNELFFKFKNRIELAYVKNKVLYVEVESNVVYQEVSFLLPQINQKLYLKIGETIKSIRMVSFQKSKKQKSENTKISNFLLQDKKETILENQKLIDDIKKILSG